MSIEQPFGGHSTSIGRLLAENGIFPLPHGWPEIRVEVQCARIHLGLAKTAAKGLVGQAAL